MAAADGSQHSAGRPSYSSPLPLIRAMRDFAASSHVRFGLFDVPRFVPRRSSSQPYGWLDAVRINPDLALKIAVEQNNVGAARGALYYGANPNLTMCRPDLAGEDGEDRILSYASRHGLVDMVELLLQWRADVHAGRVEYPLQTASYLGHTDVVNVLLRYGANPRGHPDVFLGAAQKGHIDIVKIFIEAGVDVHEVGQEALRLAAGDGQVDAILFFLSQGVDVNAEGTDGQALQAAAKNGQVEAIRVLLAKGANIHANDDAALIQAAVNGRLEAVQALLEAGANVHARNDAAFAIAGGRRRAQIIRLLQEEAGLPP